jgi:hypothetical protein
MSLVAQFRGVAIWKRSEKSRPRMPEWISGKPRSRELKDTYLIAAANEHKFAQAYRQAVAAMLDEKKRAAFAEAYKSGSVMQALNALPFMADTPHGNLDVWSDFASRMRSAYYSVMRQTSDAVANQMAQKFKRAVIFDYVSKAKLMVQTVPVNPRSLKWIDQKALNLVKEGISTEQRKVVRAVLESGFAQLRRIVSDVRDRRTPDAVAHRALPPRWREPPKARPCGLGA